MRMERKWTPAQKSAIDTRDCNVLVSAAAGSGKTAVLVERIISMITDPDKNIDIDRLVVVTFTKAAAAQMKDKIRKALDSMLDENPGDVNLLRQITLLNNAQITTIDSFCLWIIRNHFPEVNLDPGFRIMDEVSLRELTVRQAFRRWRWYLPCFMPEASLVQAGIRFQEDFMV